MTPSQIFDLRCRLQMTQDEFARALGFATRGAVCKLETGAKQPVGTTLRLLQVLAWSAEKNSREISHFLLTQGNKESGI